MRAERPSSKIPPKLVELLLKAAKENPNAQDFRKDAPDLLSETEKPLMDLASAPISPETLE